MKSMDHQGFTLVEILIALAISAVLLSGVYATFNSQRKAYITQDQVAAMQQNMRGAIHLMQREIRLAGHDPTLNDRCRHRHHERRRHPDHHGHPGRGLQGSDPDGDITDPDEDITYSLFDCDGDGDLDLTASRRHPGPGQPAHSSGASGR